MCGYNATGPGACVTAAPRQCMDSRTMFTENLYKYYRSLCLTTAIIFKISKNHIKYLNIQN